MREGIHPNYREVLFVDLSNGFKFVTRSCVNTSETVKMDDGGAARCSSWTPPASRTPSTPARRSRWTTWAVASRSSATASARSPAKIARRRTGRPGQHGQPRCPFALAGPRRRPAPTRLEPPQPRHRQPRTPSAACRAGPCCCCAWPTWSRATSAASPGRTPTSPPSATCWLLDASGWRQWLHPTLMGMPADSNALLPYWLGAWAHAAAAPLGGARLRGARALRADAGRHAGRQLVRHVPAWRVTPARSRWPLPSAARPSRATTRARWPTAACWR
jgi:hypothetical protein